jgi:hypothetical protein
MIVKMRFEKLVEMIVSTYHLLGWDFGTFLPEADGFAGEIKQRLTEAMAKSDKGALKENGVVVDRIVFKRYSPEGPISVHFTEDYSYGIPWVDSPAGSPMEEILEAADHRNSGGIIDFIEAAEKFYKWGKQHEIRAIYYPFSQFRELWQVKEEMKRLTVEILAPLYRLVDWKLGFGEEYFLSEEQITKQLMNFALNNTGEAMSGGLGVRLSSGRLIIRFMLTEVSIDLEK